MTVSRKRLFALCSIFCLGLGVIAGSGDAWRVAAFQSAATPNADPCAAILDAGTPAVEHAPAPQSPFDPDSPEQAGTTGNPADYPFDLVFIDAMIDHHQGAVRMAQITLLYAERPEVTGLATEIIASQGGEIARMRTWRDAWYPDADPVPANVTTGLMDEGMMAAGAAGGMGHGSMSTDTALALVQLCAPVGPFDLAFLDEMVPHHQSAVGMAQLARERAEHPELMTLADTIIATQEAEIAQMTTWRTQWYPAGNSAG